MVRIGGRKWWALAAVALAVLAASLDLTVLSVALPTLSVALKASESDLQWFSSGYALVLAALMLPAGLLGDRYGRKKVMLVSLAWFAVGSVACAYSRTPTEFLAARVLLGFAGAGLIVMAVSALAVLFDDVERPRAIGIWAAANMIAFPLGPILGGWLLAHYWWGWVFLMNVPVAILGFAAVAFLVPESHSATRSSLDATGMLLSGTGLAVLTYGLIALGQHGWGSPVGLVTTIGGISLTAAFFSWQLALEHKGHGQPLLDMKLFRSGSFTWGVILFAVLTLALVGVLFTVPQYLQGVRGNSPEGSGIRLLPVIGGLMAGLLPAERITKRFGAKFAAGAGFTVVAIALGVGATTRTSSGEAFGAMWMALAGVGTGLTMSTVASAALEELSEDRAGVGSGVLQALKNTGVPLGTAVVGSTLASVYVGRLNLTGLAPAASRAVRSSVFGGVATARAAHSQALLVSVKDAFVHGMDAALLVSGGFAAVGAVLALIFLPSRSQPHAADRRRPGRGERIAV